MEEKNRIREAYIEHLLENGKRPASVKRFAKDLNLAEIDFYKYYSSFDAIEKEIWAELFTEAAEKVRSEEIYTQYSAREKLLALYFTFVEGLTNNRSQMLLIMPDISPTDPRCGVLSSLRREYIQFVQEVLNEGKETGEVIDRPIISKRYAQLLWPQFLFVLNYWRRDDSPSFESTDEAIEKAVNLSFDIMGRTAFDSAFDFAKFLFQKA